MNNYNKIHLQIDQIKFLFRKNVIIEMKRSLLYNNELLQIKAEIIYLYNNKIYNLRKKFRNASYE